MSFALPATLEAMLVPTAASFLPTVVPATALTALAPTLAAPLATAPAMAGRTSSVRFSTF